MFDPVRRWTAASTSSRTTPRSRSSAAGQRVLRALAASPIRWWELGLAALHQRLVDPHVRLQVEADVGERDLGEVADRGPLAHRDHVRRRARPVWTIRGIASTWSFAVAPVACEIAVSRAFAPARARWRRHCARDLSAGIDRTPRRLVVVEDAAARVQPVAPQVRPDDGVPVRLRDGVRRDGRERRGLGLRHLGRLTEDLARRCLVHAHRRVDGADRLEQRSRRPAPTTSRLDRMLPTIAGQ